MSCLNESSSPLVKDTALLKVKEVPSIEATVTTPVIPSSRTLIPTSILSLDADKVTEVLLLTFPVIVEDVFCLN